ncbi:MAG: hypothetical protein ACO4AC_01995 [Pseudohongiellaceae bacterium]|jgi:hypothetical protein|nr:hypothetical protein [Alphaproteobacteria bacterium]
MHTCPHCNQESISTRQKLLGIAPLLVSCNNCHQDSYIHIVYALVALTVWIIMTWMLIGLAYWFRMSFLLFGSIPAMVIAVDYCLVKAPLSKVPA